jgi:hypothetical protein
VARFQIDDRVEEFRRKGKVFCVSTYERKFLVPVAAPAPAPAESHRLAEEIDPRHREEMHVLPDEGGSPPRPLPTSRTSFPRRSTALATLFVDCIG